MASLTLRGEELRLTEEGVSLDLIFDLAEVGESGTANGLHTIALMRRALYEVVHPDEHERLKAVLKKMKVRDINELNEAVGGVIAAASDRPTERPSESLAGSVPPGQPSKVVSLSRGTVSEGPVSSPAGTPAAC